MGNISIPLRSSRIIVCERTKKLSNQKWVVITGMSRPPVKIRDFVIANQTQSGTRNHERVARQRDGAPPMGILKRAVSSQDKGDVRESVQASP